jgi:general stress protein 26
MALEHEGGDVRRLLDGAARAMEAVRYCWLVNQDGEGVQARPIGHLPSADDTGMKRLFLTDRRSHKVADIRRNATIGVIFHDERQDAYVNLSGPGRLIEEAAEVQPLWQDAFNFYFPTQGDRVNACFIEVSAMELKLWIRN